MTVFYFDVYCGNELSIDDEGRELRDVLAAQIEAARALAVFVQSEMSLEDTQHQQMAVWVRDADGPVLEVQLSFAISRRSE